MALSFVDNGLVSLDSSHDMELNRRSTRLDVILNPNFGNFERFLRTLIED